jgi:hypothetical protein
MFTASLSVSIIQLSFTAAVSCQPVAYLEQISEEVITPVLAVHKDDYLAPLKPLPQNLQQPQEAISIWPDLNVLLNVSIHHTAPAHL